MYADSEVITSPSVVRRYAARSSQARSCSKHPLRKENKRNVYEVMLQSHSHTFHVSLLRRKRSHRGKCVASPVQKDAINAGWVSYVRRNAKGSPVKAMMRLSEKKQTGGVSILQKAVGRSVGGNADVDEGRNRQGNVVAGVRGGVVWIKREARRSADDQRPVGVVVEISQRIGRMCIQRKCKQRDGSSNGCGGEETGARGRVHAAHAARQWRGVVRPRAWLANELQAACGTPHTTSLPVGRLVTLFVVAVQGHEPGLRRDGLGRGVWIRLSGGGQAHCGRCTQVAARELPGASSATRQIRGVVRRRLVPRRRLACCRARDGQSQLWRTCHRPNPQACRPQGLRRVNVCGHIGCVCVAM